MSPKKVLHDSDNERTPINLQQNKQINENSLKSVIMKPQPSIDVPCSSAIDGTGLKSKIAGSKRSLIASSNYISEGTKKVRLLPTPKLISSPRAIAGTRKGGLPGHSVSELDAHKSASSVSVLCRFQNQTFSSQLEHDHVGRRQTPYNDVIETHVNKKNLSERVVNQAYPYTVTPRDNLTPQKLRGNTSSTANSNAEVTPEIAPVHIKDADELRQYQNHRSHQLSERKRYSQERALLHQNTAIPRGAQLPSFATATDRNTFLTGPSVPFGYERIQTGLVAPSQESTPMLINSVACANSRAEDMMQYCLNALSSSNEGKSTHAPAVSSHINVSIPAIPESTFQHEADFATAQVGMRSISNGSIVARVPEGGFHLAPSSTTDSSIVPNPLLSNPRAASKTIFDPTFSSDKYSSAENIDEISPFDDNAIYRENSPNFLYASPRETERIRGIESLMATFNQFWATVVHPYQQWKERAERQNNETAAYLEMLSMSNKYVVVAGVGLKTTPEQYHKSQGSSIFPDRCSFMHTGVPVALRKNESSFDAGANVRKTNRQKGCKNGKEFFNDGNVVALKNKLDAIETHFSINNRSIVYVVGNYDMENGYELDEHRFMENESFTDGPGSRRFVLKHENLIVMLMVECGVTSYELSIVLRKFFDVKKDAIVILQDGKGKNCPVWEGLRPGVYDVSFT